MPAPDDLRIEIPQEVAAEGKTSPPSTPSSSPFNTRQNKEMHLSWHELTFEVPISEGLFGLGGTKQKTLFEKQSGQLKPGQLTAIMGPSGAGKSTMMNVLAGRAPYGEITSGTVMLNGKEAQPEKYRERLAYVMQHDTLFSTQTPREALRFTAALRLPDYSEEERNDIVEKAISTLRLEKCADTLIGSETIVGLSGGEKKRTAVAVELISSPSLIFLDEPTSGLDSQTAFELISLLRDLAESGCTIVCTIHQPSSEVFQLFHRVMYLHAGRIAYDGPVEGVAAHFEHGSVLCKSNVNPSDFAMQQLQNLTEEELAPIVAKREVPADLPRRSSGKFNTFDLGKDINAGFFKQVALLSVRSAQKVVRDRAAFAARFGMAIVVSLLVGSIFFETGTEWGMDGDSPTAVSDQKDKLNNHWGSMVFATMNAMFLASQPTVLAFPLERAAFIREKMVGTYSAAAYLVAKTLVEIPVSLLQNLVSLLIVYFMVDLNGNFAFFLLSLTLLSVVSESIAVLIGSSTSNAEAAVNIMPAIYVPQILLSGFFISSNEVPVVLRWIQWLCPMKYGLALVTVTEFVEEHVPDNRLTRVSELVYNSEVNRDLWHIYVVIMLGLYLGFRVLAGIVLTVRSRKFE